MAGEPITPPGRCSRPIRGEGGAKVGQGNWGGRRGFEQAITRQLTVEEGQKIAATNYKLLPPIIPQGP